MNADPTTDPDLDGVADALRRHAHDVDRVIVQVADDVSRAWEPTLDNEPLDDPSPDGEAA